MKLLVLFWLLIAAVSAINQDLVRKVKQEVLKIGAHCLQQEKVGESDMNRFVARKLPKTHEGFCAISCVQKHLGLQKEDGIFDRVGAEKLFEPLKDEEVLYNSALNVFDEICSKLPFGEDQCENAILIMKCFIKEGAERGVTPDMLGF